MHFQLITDLNLLRQQARQWDRVAGDRPFFRFDWMGSWLQHLGHNIELAVLVATDDNGQWIGVAPWCIDQQNGLTRKLRWIGSGETCSDYLDLFTLPGFETAFADAAVEYLTSNIGQGKRLGRLDSLELEGASNSLESTRHLIQQLTAAGFQAHSTEIEGCWQVDLPSTWDELQSQLSKSMRRKTKKATKRLSETATEVLSSKDGDFDELWATFVDLHQQRRQMLGQDGCFANEHFERFLYQAIHGLAASGHAEIVQIKFEDQPLASMLLLNDGNTIYMYQSGSSERLAALEPGYQMAASAIQRSITSGFEKFDFLRGDEPYKARWNTQRIPLQRIKFIPRTLSAQVKHTLWLTGRSLKGVMSEA